MNPNLEFVSSHYADIIFIGAFVVLTVEAIVEHFRRQK